MNAKVNRSSDRDCPILKKSQHLVTDQLFLSSDLKSQTKAKNNSIKLQPIQMTSNANATFHNVDFR